MNENKYQEALNNIENIVLESSNDGYHDPRTVQDFYYQDCYTLQELVDKATPQKPCLWGDGCDKQGQIIYDMYDCPVCGKSYELDYQKTRRCDNCGQVFDWEEE